MLLSEEYLWCKSNIFSDAINLNDSINHHLKMNHIIALLQVNDSQSLAIDNLRGLGIPEYVTSNYILVFANYDLKDLVNKAVTSIVNENIAEYAVIIADGVAKIVNGFNDEVIKANTCDELLMLIATQQKIANEHIEKVVLPPTGTVTGMGIVDIKRAYLINSFQSLFDNP